MDKKVQKLENKVLKFGNTQINSEALREMTKEDFLDVYGPKISTGAKQALKEVKKYLKK
jgi:hypothetical protein